MNIDDFSISKNMMEWFFAIYRIFQYLEVCLKGGLGRRDIRLSNEVEM